MFGLSFTHLVLLGVIALVVLGPEQLPEVARTIARLLNEWKRATSDIQTSLTNTLREDLNPKRPEPPPENIKVEEVPPHAPGEYSTEASATAADITESSEDKKS